MFSLTVIDHIRMDAENAAQNYTVHARAAERMVELGFRSRIAMTVLLALSLAMTVANTLFPSRPYQIAAVATAGIALLAFVIYEIVGVEARLFAHRSFASRLWLVCERYRSLLAEVNDETIEKSTMMRRRDELIHELHTIYDFGFGIDQSGHEAERLPISSDVRAA